jgi:ADP-ribosyl-[dinitrogen reductase] hydrolase
MTPREIVHHFGVHREIVGGGWLKLKPGQVTDDTTMSLALGDAILANGGRVVPLACAQAFDAWMRRKPIDIGNTVRRNLVTFRQTGLPLAPPSDHDAGNGAAMRVLPVALAKLGAAEADVRVAVRAQAQVTHNNALSDQVCEFLTLAVQDFLCGRSLSEMIDRRITPLLAKHPELAFRDRPRRENPSGWVLETLQAVLQGLLDSTGFEPCLIDVVNRGGDADTTGAIVGMLAGALYGSSALPARWLAVLDPEIAKRCREQARDPQALAEAPLLVGRVGDQRPAGVAGSPAP